MIRQRQAEISLLWHVLPFSQENHYRLGECSPFSSKWREAFLLSQSFFFPCHHPVCSSLLQEQLQTALPCTVLPEWKENLMLHYYMPLHNAYDLRWMILKMHLSWNDDGPQRKRVDWSEEKKKKKRTPPLSPIFLSLHQSPLQPSWLPESDMTHCMNNPCLCIWYLWLGTPSMLFEGKIINSRESWTSWSGIHTWVIMAATTFWELDGILFSPTESVLLSSFFLFLGRGKWNLDKLNNSVMVT